MSDTIQTKRCRKCKQIKSPSEFHKDKTKKDGLQCLCKQCKRKYRQDHKVQWLEYSKQYIRRYRKTVKGHLGMVWANMLKRCNNPQNPDYKYYGGRGIKVKFACFEDFFNYVVKELKADPKGLTIDRIDNDGHYEQGNIRFVSQAENRRNRRK